MGQYIVASIEMKEYINSKDEMIDSAWQYNDHALSVAKKLTTTWKDTKVIGMSYFDDEIDFKTLKERFTQIKPRLRFPVWEAKNIINEFYKDKIFYNSTKKEYIRLGKYFEKRRDEREEREGFPKIENPITLLLSTATKKGGGRFPDGMLGANYVGSWAGDTVGIKTYLSTVESIQWSDVTDKYVFDEKMPKEVNNLILALPPFFESDISKGHDYAISNWIIRMNGSDFYALEYDPKKQEVFGCYQDTEKFGYISLNSLLDCYYDSNRFVFLFFLEKTTEETKVFQSGWVA